MPAIWGFEQDRKEEKSEFCKMDSTKKSKVDEGIQIDRLSELPDSVVLHILSLIDTKKAIQACILSKTLSSLTWTYLNSLRLDIRSFKDLNAFKKCVVSILSRLKTCNIYNLRFFNSEDRSFFNKLNKYAGLLGVEEIETNNEDFFMACSRFESNQSLRSLKILGHSKHKHIISEYPVFAWLTTLHLDGIALYIEDQSPDLFSTCASLEELFLIECPILNLAEGTVVKISCPRLVKLKISMTELRSSFRYLASSRVHELTISAPSLSVFDYRAAEADCTTKLSVNGCPLLNRVSIELVPDGQYLLKEGFLSSYLKQWYENVIRNVIPMTKSVTVELGGCKIILVKCNNLVSVKILGAKINDGEILLSLNLARSDVAVLFSSSPALERVVLVNVLGKVSFIFCLSIFLTRSLCKNKIEDLHLNLFDKRYSDVNQKQMESSMILAELPGIQAAFQVAWDDAFEQKSKDPHLEVLQNSQTDDSSVPLPDTLPTADISSVFSKKWQVKVTRRLYSETVWQMQWPN